MLRKTTAAVVLAGALALGTASATSLGTFNSPTFAASDTALLDCQVSGDLIELLPDIPSSGDDLSVVTDTVSNTVVSTLALASLDVTPITDALLALADGAGDPCVTGTVLDLVLLDGSGQVLDVLSVDPDAVSGLDAVSLNQVLDVVSVSEVRAVVRDVSP